jgi:hypothetical protein
MRYAKITERLEGLGSGKWAVHIEGKEREARGESLIFPSICEPDAEVPTAIMEIAERRMRAGPHPLFQWPRRAPDPAGIVVHVLTPRRSPCRAGPVPVPARHPGGSRLHLVEKSNCRIKRLNADPFSIGPRASKFAREPGQRLPKLRHAIWWRF